MSDRPVLFLASASPRRRELLAQIGLHPKVIATDVDERLVLDETATSHAARLARAKAHAGFSSLGRSDALVLAADTVVCIDDLLLGKPCDRADALRMLKMLSGQSHQVITSVALVDVQSASCVSSVTEVGMRAISVREMDDYWESGEPCDKAGAYGIQGLGAVFVSRISGSYSGVVGLPLFETAELLAAHGVYPPMGNRDE